MKRFLDRSSIRFGRPEAASVGLVALLVAAGVSGTVRAHERFAANATSGEVAQAVEELVASVELEADLPQWDLPNLDHPRVDYWVRRFSSDKRKEFERFLIRSGRYVPMISEKLTERNLPQDLIYLAMIESGFNPTAYSHAHASGLWQFIAETGRRYGLTVNQVLDERNDPVRSTDAALDYLTYLHNRFGSWYLAAAGYNTGENRVGRIMRQVTGSERGRDEDFYRIWDRLPRETRDYVPLMIAAGRIAKEPQKYGFANLQYEEPLAYDEVLAEPGAALAAIARAAGVELREVRRLNPHLKLQRVPANRSLVVRIPEGSRSTFAANWPQVRQQQLAQARAAQQRPQPAARSAQPARAASSYRVRMGDNLTAIARRHGVSVAALRSANNLRGDRIRAGQTLRIPAATQARSTQTARAQTTRAQPARVARTYRVRRGDNLSLIAQRHGVSVTALRSANNLRGDRIQAGQTLRVPAR